MTHHRGEGRRGRLTWLALTSLAAGVVLLVVGLAGQQHAPTPTAAAWGTTDPTAASPATISPAPPPGSAGSAGSTPASTPAAATPPGPASPTSAGVPDLPSTRPAPDTLQLPRSRPVSISIPAIGVHSAIVPIGTTPDGTLAVPQPGPALNKVAWYKNSPTPGQVGPAVLEGHVDTVQGISVFFRLGALRPGDTVHVQRADHTTATFTITAARAYPSHHAFPRDQVFGGNLNQAGLRLITCTDFDHHTGHYVGNLVVFAHLTSTS